MPAVISQSVNLIDAAHATWTMVASSVGTLVATITVTGTTVSAVVTQDGVQIGSSSLTNPTTTQVETAVQNFISPKIGYQFRMHIYQFNPLDFTIASFNAGVVVPAVWWP